MSNKLEAPYSDKAEQAVISSMLIKPDAVVSAVANQLTEDDFFVGTHKILFFALKKMQDEGLTIDPVTVAQFLKSLGQLEECGGIGAISEIMNANISHLNVGAYVEIVKDKSAARKILNCCRKIAVLAVSEELPLDEVIANADAMFSEIRARANQKQIITMKVASDLLWNRLKEASITGNVTDAISTGYLDLDKVIKIKPGQTWVVAGRPGKGKSALGLNLTSNMCSRSPSVRVGIITIEMRCDELLERVYAYEASVPLSRFDQVMTADELEAIEDAKKRVGEWPLFIDEASNQTPESIRRVAKKMVDHHKINILIIDYLQLIEDTSSKFEREQLTKISRTIKNTAKELSIPIIVLAQLNRDVSKEGREPGLHDLKGSGSIEQDADGVLLLHWTGEDGVVPLNHQYPCFIKVAKQRRGASGSKINMTYNGPYLRFQEEWKSPKEKRYEP